MRSKMPTIIAVLLLVVGLGAGVFLIQKAQTFKLGASPDITPQDVRITNISDTSVSVSFITDKKVTSFLLWGETENLGQTTASQNSETENVHFINLQGLSPATTYFFKINSGGSEFDNNAIPWQVKTAPKAQGSASSQSISGTVVTATGTPAANVMVYVNTGGLTPVAAITSGNGAWIIPVGGSRNSDLSAFFTPTQGEQKLLDIFVQAGPGGIATAQIFLDSANPTPPIILGQTHDFRSQPAGGVGETGQTPKVDLNLPEEATKTSGFNLSDKATASPSAATVTLKSIDEGEVVTTTEPEFFGSAPAGTTLTITVQSETPQTDTIKAPSTGEWKWSPPEGLAPGSHTVTIQWKDAAGILRTLTRNFVVQAAEGPAFESTPSATLKPTAKPSASPRISLPATDEAVPVSGSLTPTLMLFMMGVGLLGLAMFIGKKALE